MMEIGTGMKTARFSQVVKSIGRAEPHLALVAPEEDGTFQKAIKGRRVMTVYQNARGSKTDYGEVGFHPGTGRQYLIFPKSLARYEGVRIVGIKYDLTEPKPIPKSQQAERPAAPKRKVSKRGRAVTGAAIEKEDSAEENITSPKKATASEKETKAPEKKARATRRRAAGASSGAKGRRERKERPKASKSPSESGKIVAFPISADVDEDDEAKEVARLKKQVRRAMAALEDGKQVAAFNLLKRLVEG